MKKQRVCLEAEMNEEREKLKGEVALFKLALKTQGDVEYNMAMKITQMEMEKKEMEEKFSLERERWDWSRQNMERRQVEIEEKWHSEREKMEAKKEKMEREGKIFEEEKNLLKEEQVNFKKERENTERTLRVKSQQMEQERKKMIAMMELVDMEEEVIWAKTPKLLLMGDVTLEPEPQVDMKKNTKRFSSFFRRAKKEDEEYLFEEENGKEKRSCAKKMRSFLARVWGRKSSKQYRQHNGIELEHRLDETKEGDWGLAT
ncbi:hypothetical protein SKAU_G00285470 [Synaphobranchus kaupii]|uniref:Uncharacterized protein n=1 Tax=Synaphobranchus kaupii TaxID=118154 RepID=A0A9Q1EXX6_SYNKA|nr:hypothetical protein SKAU_G00285470 [Synaphobranchus kaupii]